MMHRCIDIGPHSVSIETPCVMGIINCTPDSFYSPSRVAVDDVTGVAAQMVADGAAILDIGGCSTRPHSEPVDEAGEWRRVEPALRVLRRTMPDIPLSLDTFRTEIARRAIETFGPMIINDISGGSEDMYALVRKHDVPYVYTGAIVPESLRDYAYLIYDPGLGFLGSNEADYEALRTLQKGTFPILVGLSRKSMIYKPLGITPDDTLPATQALHMYALMHGADILRVHDVRPTVQTIQLFNLLEKNI